jgi:hypothetical protein
MMLFVLVVRSPDKSKIFKPQKSQQCQNLKKPKLFNSHLTTRKLELVELVKANYIVTVVLAC